VSAIRTPTRAYIMHYPLSSELIILSWFDNVKL